MSSIIFAREFGIWAAVLWVSLAVYLHFNPQLDVPLRIPALFYTVGVILLALSSPALHIGRIPRIIAFGAFLSVILATALAGWLFWDPGSPTKSRPE